MQQPGLSSMNYSLLFQRWYFFIIGNQAAKFAQFINPWVLFLLKAMFVVPFILGSPLIILYIAGTMVFKFFHGPYYSTANFIALLIKGNKTGMAASITDFIQTAGARTIRFFAIKRYWFQQDACMSTLSLAILSLLVVT
ncbi:hypothetical protein LMR84_26425 [Klebsiella variicola]|nr:MULTISPECIES: hypothetical protein [Klebsiella]MCC5458510.1 hypothetical protein [Klebsiella variicola]